MAARATSDKWVLCHPGGLADRHTRERVRGYHRNWMPQQPQARAGAVLIRHGMFA